VSNTNGFVAKIIEVFSNNLVSARVPSGGRLRAGIYKSITLLEKVEIRHEASGKRAAAW
jgi:hypothetical protein